MQSYIITVESCDYKCSPELTDDWRPPDPRTRGRTRWSYGTPGEVKKTRMSKRELKEALLKGKLIPHEIVGEHPDILKWVVEKTPLALRRIERNLMGLS